MCTVSMTGDMFHDRWTQPGPYTVPIVPQTYPTLVVKAPPSREEFDALKREVELMHDLLKRAAMARIVAKSARSMVRDGYHPADDGRTFYDDEEIR